MQSPALYPLVAPEGSPRRPQRCSPTVADRPCLPIRSRFSRRRTTRPGVPSFFSRARLAVGFGPKELSPTPGYPGDSPREPCGPCGSPAPRRHPEVRRLLAMLLSYLVYARHGRLSTLQQQVLRTQATGGFFSELRVDGVSRSSTDARRSYVA